VSLSESDRLYVGRSISFVHRHKRNGTSYVGCPPKPRHI